MAKNYKLYLMRRQSVEEETKQPQQQNHCATKNI